MSPKTLPASLLVVIGLVPASVAAQDTWESRDSLPAPFRGRWGLMVVSPNGIVRAENACSREPSANNDLVIGGDWFISATGQGFITHIEYSDVENTARVRVVDNADGELALTQELYSLEDDGRTLTVASNPEIGWDTMTYQRCD